MKQLSRALSLAALVGATFTQASHLDTNSYSFNVGPTLNYAQFRTGLNDTLDNDANRLRTTGWLAGVHADFTYEHACRVFAKVRFDGRWNAGNVSSFTNIEEVPAADRSQRFKVRDFRPEFDLGYTFAFGDCDNFELTPFTGVGYIFFSRQRRVFEAENLQPRRQYTTVYVPVGLQFKWLKDECFDVALSAEYRIGVSNHVRDRVRGQANDDKIKLQRTQGLLVEVPLTWHRHDDCSCYDFHMKLVPYFDWNKWGRRKDNPQAVDRFRLRQFYAGFHLDLGVHF